MRTGAGAGGREERWNARTSFGARVSRADHGMPWRSVRDVACEIWE